MPDLHTLQPATRRSTAGYLAITLYTLWLGGCAGTAFIPPTIESSGENTGEATSDSSSELPAPGTDTGSATAQPGTAESPEDAARTNAAGVLLAQSENFRKNGQLPKAVALVERAIRLEPSRGDLWVQLGRLRFEEGELARAEQYARKGIALTRNTEPARQLGWLLLADISEAHGDTAGAEQIRSQWLNNQG